MSLHGYDLPRGNVECDWPHDAELQNAYKRIAELEAELAIVRETLRTYEDMSPKYLARAEKAEAEVGQLKKERDKATEMWANLSWMLEAKA